MRSRAAALRYLAAYGAAAIGFSGPAILAAPETRASLQQSHLLVVVGIGGEESYRELFHNWAIQIVNAGIDAGVQEKNVVLLSERAEPDPDRIDGRSTRDNVEQAIRQIAGRAAPADRVFIVLIGHGSAQGEQSRFNIPGPDMTSFDFGALLDLFPTQPVAFINTTSASGDFIKHLSGDNRTVITATRDGRQFNETVFPRYFAEALTSDIADLDKDERVSMLEAYVYASREVRRFYESEGRLLTETSLLDDNGDGKGSNEPDPATADGAQARTLFFQPLEGRAGPLATTPEASADPELRSLFEERRLLQEKIDQLKQRKDTMDPGLYLEELEVLLVELAVKDRAIRNKGGEQQGGRR